MENLQKVLVISLGDLKDTIYTLPLVCILKRKGYFIEYLTSEKGFEAVNKNPVINRVHLAPVEQWIKKMPYWGIWEDMGEVVKKLQKREFDIAIDCQMTMRSAYLFAKCGAKRRLSFSTAQGFSSFGANEFIDTNPEFKNTNVHKVEKNLNFARYLGLKTDGAEFFLPELKYEAKTKMDKFINFAEEKPIIVLSPNMLQGEVSWHPKNWVNLVTNIPEKYNIIVIGDNQDNVLATRLSHKNLVNLCGKTRFEDLRYILSLADIIVSNNLETSAVAWAMNKSKVITISTSMSPAMYNPFNLKDDNKYITLTGNLACQPCNKTQCENSSYKCSHSPTVEAVLNAIR